MMTKGYNTNSWMQFVSHSVVAQYKVTCLNMTQLDCCTELCDIHSMTQEVVGSAVTNNEVL